MDYFVSSLTDELLFFPPIMIQSGKVGLLCLSCELCCKPGAPCLCPFGCCGLTFDCDGCSVCDAQIQFFCLAITAALPCNNEGRSIRLASCVHCCIQWGMCMCGVGMGSRCAVDHGSLTSFCCISFPFIVLVPPQCACLGLTVYPKCGCCMPVKEVMNRD